MDISRKLKAYKRELEKNSISSDESDSKVKVLESKIEVLEKALKNALDAINAGVNLLLYRNSDDEIMNLIESVLSKSLDDIELQNKINVSYEKIINFKNKCKFM